MPPSIGFLDYIVDPSGLAGDLIPRKMMGGLLLYFRGNLIGGVYEARLLLKRTTGNASLCLRDSIPYQGAKSLLLANVDDRYELRKAILATAEGLTKG